jgi:hypothetical protein
MALQSFDPSDYVAVYSQLNCCLCNQTFTYFGHHNPIRRENGVKKGFVCQSCYDSKTSLVSKSFDKAESFIVQAGVGLLVLFLFYIVFAFLLG